MLGVDWTDMGQRVAINNVTLDGVTQVPIIVVVVSDLMLDGVGGNECDHIGLCDNKQSRHMRFHGTNDIKGLLASGGLQKPELRRRPLSGKPGWNHYPADLWRESVQYAIPQHLGNSLFRCVCEYDIRCWNSCGGGRTWHYTKDDCNRYSLVAIWLLPACLCSAVPINCLWTLADKYSARCVHYEGCMTQKNKCTHMHICNWQKFRKLHCTTNILNGM